MIHTLIEGRLDTPLGVVNCGLSSSESTFEEVGKYTYQNGNSEIIRSASFSVELIEVQIGPHTDGWIWRFSKENDVPEEMQIHFNIDKSDKVNCIGPASGQGLDAIEVYSENVVAHLGTEGGDALNERARRGKGFPERFFQPGKDVYILDYKENGFLTKLPTLRVNEVIHLHYICALGNSPDDDFETWTKVDVSKSWIETKLGKRVKFLKDEKQ